MSEDKILKVIMVGNAPSVKGGITSVISQIMSHNWRDQNIEMSFIPTFEDGSAVNKIRTFVKGYLQLHNLCKSRKVDVVHIHMSHKGSFSRKYCIHKLCKKYGIADIIHLHSSEFVGFYENASENKKRRIRELMTECNCVVALGKEWEQRIKKIAPQAKIQVMNNTIHIPMKCTDQNVECIKFLYLGVLVKRKGVIDLLKAIKKLKEDGILESGKAIFNIGGTGECELELKEYVRENSLESYVRFLGWVAGEEKIKQLQTNQVLVLPSYNEGLPISILEAISYGMPVVATNVGSVAEAVHDGENGFLYKAGDIDALTKALKGLLSSDTLRIKMGDNSRKLAESKFDDALYFDTLNRMYRKVVE